MRRRGGSPLYFYGRYKSLTRCCATPRTHSILTFIFYRKLNTVNRLYLQSLISLSWLSHLHILFIYIYTHTCICMKVSICIYLLYEVNYVLELILLILHLFCFQATFYVPSNIIILILFFFALLLFFIYIHFFLTEFFFF